LNVTDFRNVLAAHQCGPTGNGTQLAFSPEEVAAAISFHPESIRRGIREGVIAAVKVGTAWRVPLGELQRIATQGCRRLSSPPRTPAKKVAPVQ